MGISTTAEVSHILLGGLEVPGHEVGLRLPLRLNGGKLSPSGQGLFSEVDRVYSSIPPKHKQCQVKITFKFKNLLFNYFFNSGWHFYVICDSVTLRTEKELVLRDITL